MQQAINLHLIGVETPRAALATAHHAPERIGALHSFEDHNIDLVGARIENVCALSAVRAAG